jgi:ectoine hydroxylase-related dioxygenase (phytanoyl-CoA dioxygenase family)
LNWWLPIYGFEPESSMAFHPHYWNKPVANGSSQFNYYEWNRDGRKNAAQSIKSDNRKQPKPNEPMNLEPSMRLVCEPGGVIVFSAAQMHSTVPNTSGRTRFSIDFRTVHNDDIVSQVGAPNIDSACTGTSLRDFMRGTDLSRFREDVVQRYDSNGSAEDVLVYQPR